MPIIREDEKSILDITSFPPGVRGTSEGNTGLDQGLSSPWYEGTILDYLSKLDYGQYNAPIWDCEDQAFWGVAHVRHRFPGCPIGIASGLAKQGSGQVQHALVILWCADKNGKISASSEYKYFDPRKGTEIDKADFKTELYVPFPVENKGSKQKVPPLNVSPFDTPMTGKYFIWDYVHDWESFTAQNVKQYIIDDERLTFRHKYESGCEEFAPTGTPVNPSDLHKVMDMNAARIFWSREDRAVWAFAHARRKFKGFPIGIALGKSSTVENDAVLVLWETPAKWFYLHLDKGIITDFVPRIVWV